MKSSSQWCCSFKYWLTYTSLRIDTHTRAHTHTQLSFKGVNKVCTCSVTDNSPSLVPEPINHLERGFPWSCLSPQADTDIRLMWPQMALRHIYQTYKRFVSKPLFMNLQVPTFFYYSLTSTNQICEWSALLLSRESGALCCSWVFCIPSSTSVFLICTLNSNKLSIFSLYIAFCGDFRFLWAALFYYYFLAIRNTFL